MKTLIFFLSLSVALVASDTVTMGNMQWQDNAEAKTNKLNWEDAKSYCQELSLVGHNDWRLPNIKELQSITDVSRYNPAIKKSFMSVASRSYWSSSQGVSGVEYAWVVYFKYGGTGHRTKSYEGYVRCVRHRQ